MWNIKEIKDQKIYVVEKLKNCINPQEQEKLELTLANYLTMLDNSGTIRYTKIPNIIDNFINNKLSLKRNQKINKLSALQTAYGELNDDYVSFLLELCNNIIQTDNEYGINLKNIDEKDIATGTSNDNKCIPMEYNHQYNPTLEELKQASKSFYQILGDEELTDKATKVMKDDSCFNISDTFRNGYERVGGIAFFDRIFDKTYIDIRKSNDLFEYQAFNHEVMHGIDYLMNKNQLPSKYYEGFQEVPTYTIDYFFIDYLETLNFPEDEVHKLRAKKDYYLQNLAMNTKFNIDEELRMNYINGPNGKGYIEAGEKLHFGIPEIKNFLKDQKYRAHMGHLLELEAGVVSYGLYKQIKENKEMGLNSLKELMRNPLPKDQIPDFSFINLDNDTLLDLSKEIGTFGHEKTVSSASMK